MKSIMFDNGKKPEKTRSGAAEKATEVKDSYYGITFENESGELFTIAVMLLRS